MEERARTDCRRIIGELVPVTVESITETESIGTRVTESTTHIKSGLWQKLSLWSTGGTAGSIVVTTWRLHRPWELRLTNGHLLNSTQLSANSLFTVGVVQADWEWAFAEGPACWQFVGFAVGAWLGSHYSRLNSPADILSHNTLNSSNPNLCASFSQTPLFSTSIAY